MFPGGESLRITICLESMLVGMQGHVPCGILLFCQLLFFVSVKFHEDHNCHKVEVSMVTLTLWDITGFTTVVSFCVSQKK